jgi:SAM-dependent methyltransferase
MFNSPNGKTDIQNFWGAVYRTAYGESDATLDREILLRRLVELEDMFRMREHLAVVEMPIDALDGLRILEVGPGAGGHSALFASRGARMTSIDVTWDRAVATQRKFNLLNGDAGTGSAGQGDAESLPFADDTFDIVYSNGVLHHTHDTERAVNEVFRVLRPGGRAVIMLYSKGSLNYWFSMWFCVGILKGGIIRSSNWLGHASEWIGTAQQTVINPITRCYTARELRRMFRKFNSVTLRKSEFNAGDIPKIGRIWRRWRLKRYGTHPGGVLVYGEPWEITTPCERWLGKRIGWAWNIQATKI